MAIIRNSAIADSFGKLSHSITAVLDVAFPRFSRFRKTPFVIPIDEDSPLEGSTRATLRGNNTAR